LEDLQKVTSEKQQLQDEFSQRLQQLEATFIVLQQTRTEGHGGFKEPKISLPTKFDGTRSQFRGLIIQMHPARYPTTRYWIVCRDSLLRVFPRLFSKLRRVFATTISALIATKFDKQFTASLLQTFNTLSQAGFEPVTSLHTIKSSSKLVSIYTANLRQFSHMFARNLSRPYCNFVS
jgi:hypothetical protein